MPYVAEWLELRQATNRIIENEQRKDERFADIGEELVAAIRDGKVATRWPEMPIGNVIPPEQWGWFGPVLTSERLSEVLVSRTDVDRLWPIRPTVAGSVFDIAISQKQRGRPRVRRLEAAAKMRADIEAERFSFDELDKMKPAALGKQYDIDPRTAKKALDILRNAYPH